ncbi:OprO/OprP family phosphate-selective porin [Salisaeta longa]|uniref:OprO/OprP family phosphate-selective porin n=1 Tax=Salisaeta longa TaxID=503170 RepID=UPI0003B6898D|nr:porin [Salisaeta longa]
MRRALFRAVAFVPLFVLFVANGYAQPSGLNVQTEAVTVHVGGAVQADGRFFPTDQPAPGAEQFALRRARIIVEGTIYERFSVRVMPNFGQGTAGLDDAYVNMRLAPALQLRGGTFKMPVGLEFAQSPYYMHLIERAFPTALVPGRSAGVMVHGSAAADRVQYSVGVFNGVPSGTSAGTDSDNLSDVAARVFVHPFAQGAPALRGLGLGVGASAGEAQGTAQAAQLSRFRTSGRQSFFAYAPSTVADGVRQHLAPQGYWYVGPVGLMGEYVWATQAVQNGGAQATLTHTAWQVAAGVMLTGEDARFGRLVPQQPLHAGGIGAFSLDARVHGLSLDAATFPAFARPAEAAQSARAWAVGFSWYPNQNVRFVLNYEQTAFDTFGAAADRPTEHALLGRMQLVF